MVIVGGHVSTMFLCQKFMTVGKNLAFNTGRRLHWYHVVIAVHGKCTMATTSLEKPKHFIDKKYFILPYK